MAKSLRVGAAQLPAYPLKEADQALGSIERALEQAAEQRVELLVLPECAYPAYLIGSVDAYRRCDVLPADEYLILLCRQARKKHMYIVSGYVEDMGTHLHNSAVLIDDAGQTIGNYRKSFLWAGDNAWFKAGDSIEVCPTRLGNIGMVICADTRAPEIIAKLIINGAQLVAMPTCWINIAAQRGGYENPQPEYLISTRAKEFEVPFVCANKFGMETEKVGYCGRSIIADGTGRILQEAPGNEETLLVGEIELRDADRAHAHGELWDSLMQWQAPEPVQVKSPEPLMVALMPGPPVDHRAFEWVSEQGADVLIANGLADERVVLEHDIDVILPAHIGALRALRPGKVGCLSGEEVLLFGRSRLMALGGASVLCVFEAPDDLKLLRTRAMENRVFVCAIGERVGAIIHPTGEVMGYSTIAGDEGLLVGIHVADAALKTVAPGTDIWEQRRVDAYR